jgi:hypothetical protein
VDRDGFDGEVFASEGRCLLAERRDALGGDAAVAGEQLEHALDVALLGDGECKSGENGDVRGLAAAGVPSLSGLRAS